ncbi:MAG: hypothetical protein JWQ74_353 [Marmoricola sp.]|nr:hypothetical protein [Marmoricola sp.]
MALGLTLVATSAAQAATVTPTTNQVLAGNFQFSTSALGDGSLCVNATKSNVTWSLINSANAVVFGPTKVDAVNAATSAVIDTHTLPNGAYTARAVEQRRTGTIICSNPASTTINTPVTINNVVDLSLDNSLATSAPQNTSIPVSATLTDPNLAASVLPGRTITFSLSGGGSVNATTNASGVATASLPIAGPPRTGATVTASFAATLFYGAKSASRSIDVTKNDTATTVVQPAAVVHGQATSFTASVAATNGGGVPSGSVQFKVDGTDLGAPVTLSAGSATSVSTNSLSTGAHAVTAVYSGDGNYFASTSAAKNQVVNKAATTTTLTDAPSGSTVAGEAVTFTAHVDVVSPGVGTLGGAVQFNVDGAPFGTAVALGAGDNATLTISNLPVANHDVIAVYNGNADFAQSSSAQLTHGVGKANTTLDLTSSVNPAFSGAPITYTAVVAPVAPGAGSPTGGVQFAVDGVNLGSPVSLSGGQAVSPVSTQQVGTHVITANYVGDANFSGQTDNLNQVVVAAQTTTSITTTPNPSVFGQAITIHAEVTPVAPATGAPTGAIRFIVDGTTYDFVDMVGGGADLTLNGLSVGSHTVKAVYLSDDLNFFTSTSTTIDQTVNKAATKTVVSSNASPAVFGQPVTFTANVSVLAPGAGAPAGTIVFKDGSTTIGTQPVSSATGEQASITVSNLSVGQHAISAVYSGDDSFNGSTGNTPQAVSRAQTAVVLASSANPATSGQGVQFTANVSPVAPGAGDPTGTVRFFVNGANLGSPVAVDGDGNATSSNFASLSPGTYTITATYSGDGNFVGSSGVLDQGNGQTVEKAGSSLTVTSGPSPASYGDAVTVTSTVVGSAPAVGKPTGVVQVWEGDELLGATSLVPQSAANTSKATFVVSTLSAGSHALKAVYVGNFNFAGSTNTTNQTVGQVPTVTGVSSSANPAVFGDTVTFIATVGSSTGSPTGTVTFKEGSTVLGTAPVATNGGARQASLAVPGLHAGAHGITAVYSGDVSFGTSTSAAYSQSITKAPTTIFAADVNNPGPFAPRTNWIRAKLLDRYGNPLVGRAISFDAPPGQARPARHLCDAVTNAAGIAECNDQVVSIDIGLAPGDTLLDIHGTYDVTFAGDADNIGATARGHQY